MNGSNLSPVYLFQGEGIGPICLDYTEKMFQKYENPIIKIDYSYLIRNLDHGTLVLSGGISNKQLWGICKINMSVNKNHSQAPFQILKQNIEKGFNYIGICAGGYTGAKEYVNIVDADYTPYSYSQVNQKLKVRSVKASVNRIDPTFGENIPKLSVPYFGGPEFTNIGKEVNVLARFSDNGSAAVVSQQYRHSQALLVSYHPEFSSEEFLNQNDLPSVFSDNLEPSISKEEFFSDLHASQSKVESFTSACFATLNIQRKSRDVLEG
ncbi:MAG: BPL-N domain-containing protein [Parachlamydiaceae bacterium]|nr:BPL-N domain-containing protein [Parachlamydiaceae bacterium]